MRLRSARTLLSLFILSVSFIQVTELGHSLLHSFENPFHYHKVRKLSDYSDHTLVDHHFPKMQFAHEMDEPQSPNNFIALAFGFFQAIDDLRFYSSENTVTHFTKVTEHLYVITTCPPTPPPLTAIQA